MPSPANEFSWSLERFKLLFKVWNIPMDYNSSIIANKDAENSIKAVALFIVAGLFLAIHPEAKDTAQAAIVAASFAVIISFLLRIVTNKLVVDNNGYILVNTYVLLIVSMFIYFVAKNSELMPFVTRYSEDLIIYLNPHSPTADIDKFSQFIDNYSQTANRFSYTIAATIIGYLVWVVKSIVTSSFLFNFRHFIRSVFVTFAVFLFMILLIVPDYGAIISDPVISSVWQNFKEIFSKT